MRKFPKQGYYVYNFEKHTSNVPLEHVLPVDVSNPSKLDIVYCSGTTKGNFYWDPRHHDAQWNRLLWTCVPAINQTDLLYDYYETNPIDVQLP